MPPVDPPTVLLVSPEPRTRAALKTALRHDGWRVLSASGALEALLVGARETVQIDLLVTASDLPGIDGRKLAEKFRQPFPAVTVLYLEAEPATASLERIRQALAPARKQPEAQAAEPKALAG